jgi:predicted membrane protein
MSNSHNKSSRAWVGIVLVALGGYFLLRNFDLIPHSIHYLFGWEMILIIVGGSMLVTGRRQGIVLLAIGGLFLAPEILDIPRIRMRDWWPLILIIIGISIFLKRRGISFKDTGEVSDDHLDNTTIFGGSEKTFTSQNFKGGKVTAVFGGSELYLTNAQLDPNGAMIDCFCMFGGHEFYVPNDWTVINESFVVFGGYSDNRSKTMKDEKKVLRIKGFIMFGGVEVNGV